MEDLVIVTSGLTRRFGQLTAVDDLNLEVPAGCVYGFLGPNGAGKTTTIRMLLGLLRPHAGQVQLFSKPLQSERLGVLGRVGALVESPSLYPNLTGRENLEVTRLLCGGTKEQIERVLRIVHLEDAARRPVSGYSTGMRQRLALALALLNHPGLLILDEPTSGLDPAGIIEMRDLIGRLPADHGVTVFLSSHLLAEVEQMATDIGIINHGRLCFQGRMDDLRARMEDQLVLGVEQPSQAKAMLEQSGWVVRSNGNRRITVAVSGRSDATLVNDMLVTAGMRVFHLSVQQPRLEDMFLQLTGDGAGGI